MYATLAPTPTLGYLGDAPAVDVSQLPAGADNWVNQFRLNHKESARLKAVALLQAAGRPIPPDLLPPGQAVATGPTPDQLHAQAEANAALIAAQQKQIDDLKAQVPPPPPDLTQFVANATATADDWVRQYRSTHKESARLKAVALLQRDGRPIPPDLQIPGDIAAQLAAQQQAAVDAANQTALATQKQLQDQLAAANASNQAAAARAAGQSTDALAVPHWTDPLVASLTDGSGGSGGGSLPAGGSASLVPLLIAGGVVVFLMSHKGKSTTAGRRKKGGKRVRR